MVKIKINFIITRDEHTVKRTVFNDIILTSVTNMRLFQIDLSRFNVIYVVKHLNL